MTDVLDELRNVLTDPGGSRAPEWVLCAIEAFEAAHPKIVDLETVTTADLSRLGFSVRLCTKGDSCTKAGP